MAIPRVFVSSTYYDLKFVREKLEKFITDYNFEPILFESGSITYEHNKPIDASAYNEVKLCHMMILIVGGRYGSAISGQDIDGEQKAYDTQHISITRKEFETAIKKNIPVFIFIDKNVYSEYQTYRENTKLMEASNFKFAHVDSINVFKFIDILKSKPIKPFEKIEEIEVYLKNQFSGMFYLYLENLQNEKRDNEILDTVTELNNVTQRMNEMIKAVGKNVIQDSDYQNVLQKQFKILIEFYSDNIRNNLRIKNEIELQELDLDKITNLFISDYLNESKINKILSIEETEEKFNEADKHDDLFIQKWSIILVDAELISIDFWEIAYPYYNKILPIINENTGYDKIFRQKLNDSLRLEITGLPF